MTTRPTVIRGVSRLTCDAVEQLTNLVEAMHANIAALSPPLGAGTDGRTHGITGFVYDNIRLVTGAVRVALDHSLALLTSDAGPTLPPARAEAVLSVLNGVLGDYLVASGNPLAIPMQLRCDGESVAVEREALTRSLPRASRRLLVLVHGSCMNDRQWTRNGHDHGAALARDLGYVPLYLLYNSGRHVSENGRELAELLDSLAECWPVPLDEVVILAHSMGGLVTRSACHYGKQARHGWIEHLRKLVFLGTPHHGAPLERGGTLMHTLLGISPYSAPLARLGAVRSAGVTDLRFGSVLDDDWVGRDRFESDDCRIIVPLPADIACYAAAATLGRQMDDLNDRLFGDGLVPVDSALGRHADPDKTLAIPVSRQWIGFGMSHWDLLDHAEVYERLHRWLTE